MRWPDIEEIAQFVPLPQGYTLAQLGDSQVAELAAKVGEWHPDISVGAGSCFLREDFYRDKVFLAGQTERDIMVLLILFESEMVGLFAFEREPDALTMFGKLLIVSPTHRNSKVGMHCLAGTAALSKACGAEFAYTMATLKIPHVQIALERAGYMLLGFTPGYDREIVGNGEIKRVFEAVYAKVLVDDKEILRPRPENLTPAARTLFEALFPVSSSRENAA
ncbi:MAG: hypothetical protein JSR19_06325 [Proteobacteria bacterium]|nr:hypothetical protein [Pseudomonadota bacterium]HQR04787.1 hypothetical protein [Rhodocyclaceae bacterium]